MRVKNIKTIKLTAIFSKFIYNKKISTEFEGFIVGNFNLQVVH